MTVGKGPYVLEEYRDANRLGLTYYNIIQIFNIVLSAHRRPFYLPFHIFSGPQQLLHSFVCSSISYGHEFQCCLQPFNAVTANQQSIICHGNLYYAHRDILIISPYKFSP